MNAATIVSADGVDREVATTTKIGVANAVWDAVLPRLPRAKRSLAQTHR